MHPREIWLEMNGELKYHDVRLVADTDAKFYKDLKLQEWNGLQFFMFMAEEIAFLRSYFHALVESQFRISV